MMKYKGWNTKKKMMYSVEELTESQLTLMPDGSGFWNISGDHETMSENYPYILPLAVSDMLDSQGVAVAEGDLLEFAGEKFEVKFGESEGSCGWFLSGFMKIYGFFKETVHRGTIVGNIYEGVKDA